jgi:hypothetical protein
MPHAVLTFISSAAGFALGVLLTMSLKFEAFHKEV